MTQINGSVWLKPVEITTKALGWTSLRLILQGKMTGNQWKPWSFAITHLVSTHFIPANCGSWTGKVDQHTLGWSPYHIYIYTHRWAFKKPKCRTYICGLVKWNGHGDDKYEWNQHRFEWDNHQNFMFFEITPAFFLRWTNSAQNNHVETQTTANKTKTLCNPFPLGYWSFPAIARLQ